jgi:hypothetical protein
MAGLADYVKETASAPGTSTTFNLGGATAPFVTFASVFGNGSTPYYFMRDATQWEAGESTLTHGTPNTLSRTTVLANSAGTTSKLNFAGTTTVYCALPASKAIRFDQFNQATGAEGFVALPGGIIYQWGPVDVTTDGSGNATFSFGQVFPTACWQVIVSNGNATTSSSIVNLIGKNTSQAQVNCPTRLSNTYTVSYLAIGN